MSIERQLIELCFKNYSFNEETLKTAQMLLTDTLHVGYAGASNHFSFELGECLREENKGQIPILGREYCLNRSHAALLNGFNIHCLEWDCVHEGAVVHALSTIVAALISECHKLEIALNDERALKALIIGVEFACRLGLASKGRMRFFRPANAGLFGAILALSKLNDFTQHDCLSAFGIGYAQMSGNMQAHVEGSIALPLQIGFAARAAINSIDLAVHGLRGANSFLTGDFGYFALFEVGDASMMLHDWGTEWQIEQISIKPWPCGRASHATLQAISEFKDFEIRKITVRVPPLVNRLINRKMHSKMETAYARLCLPFLCGLMFRDGIIDPREFVQSNFENKYFAQKASILEIQLDDNQNQNALSPQHFEIITKSSKENLIINEALGSPTNPMSENQKEQKYKLAESLTKTGIKPSDLIEAK